MIRQNGIIRSRDHSGDTVRYGGGYTGGAVVPDRIDPEEVYGVLLSSHFTDKDISETFDEKVISLDPSSPINYFRIFNDEINLLGLFGLLDTDMEQGVGYMREQYKRATELHFAINDPGSFTNIALNISPEEDVDSAYLFFGGDAPETADSETRDYHERLLEQQEQKKIELNATLDDPEIHKYANALLEAGKT